MKRILISLILGIMLIGIVSAWTNTTFNNSLSAESLQLNISSNVTRYLSIPSSVSYLFNGTLNLSGILGGADNLTVGLEDYYHLNNDLVNTGGRNRTLANTLCSGRASGGILAGYYYCAGGAYLTISNFNITDQKNFTISMWVYLNVTNADNNLLYIVDDATLDAALQVYFTDTDVLRFWIGSTGLTGSGVDKTSIYQKWTHMVFTQNDTTRSIYVNGTLKGSDTNAETISGNSLLDLAKEIMGGIDEFMFYNRSLSATEVQTLYNSSNGYDVATPSYPTNISLYIGTTKVFDYVGLFSQSNNKTNNLASTINSYLTAPYLVGSTYRIPFIFGSNSISGGWINYSDLNFSSLGILENSNSSNYTTYETAYETFVSNVSIGGDVPITSANLIWNGTSYSATVTNTTSSDYIMTKSIDIPTGPGLKNWYYELIFSNNNRTNTSITQQNVVALNLTLCSASPYNVPYINFSFKNETLAQESVSASFSSTWVYWISSATNNKTLSYTNTTANPSYAFCLSPGNKTISSTLSISYYNSYSVQRNYAPGTLSLSNATVNTTLWLLPTSDGLYVTFQVINLAEQIIDGTLVNISRSGVGLIESKETDDAGLATFFMNPNFAYTVEAYKSGYPAFSTTITPTQSSYTITLGGGIASSTNISDYFKGVSYTIGPAKAFLNNGTTYQFNISLASNFWDIDSFGFVLRNSSGGIVASNSSTSNGGLVSFSLNVGTNSSIKMDYFWVIGGNYTNASTYWIVSDTSGTGFSLWHFGTRLRTYIIGGVGDTDGLFGLTSFGLNIIVFFIIIISTGLVAYKVGFDRPLLIVGVMLAVTFLFDVVLTFITYPASITDVLPVGGATLLIGLLFIGLLVKEATQ